MGGAVTIWMPVEPEANELLSRSPPALLIAMLLDQQVTLEKAFAGPLDLVRRLGHEPTVAELAEFDPDRLAAIFSDVFPLMAIIRTKLDAIGRDSGGVGHSCDVEMLNIPIGSTNAR